MYVRLCERAVKNVVVSPGLASSRILHLLCLLPRLHRMHFSRESSLLHPGAGEPKTEPEIKVKQEERPVCAQGSVVGYGRFARDCRGWWCKCPLKGECRPPREICEHPCKKHFPKTGEYKCIGGRGRIMPNGCIAWQCNCQHSLMGNCVKPLVKVASGVFVPPCKSPCPHHNKNPKCERCGEEITIQQFQTGDQCDQCSSMGDTSD